MASTSGAINIHPMAKINRNALKAIPDGWFDEFNKPNIMRHQSTIALLKQNVTVFVIVNGNQYSMGVTAMKEAFGGLFVDFTCGHRNRCLAVLRIYNLRESDLLGLREDAPKEIVKDVMLMSAHDCLFSRYQRRCLIYMDAIRRHFIKNQDAKLNSHTGFYIHEPGEELDAKLAVYDHYFVKRPSDYQHNTNHLRIVECNGCSQIVHIMRRKIVTCEVVAATGKQSKEISTHTFSFVDGDEIPSLEMECANPMYFFYGRNVLGYRLAAILPQLGFFVGLLGWTKKYEENTPIEIDVDDGVYDEAFRVIDDVNAAAPAEAVAANAANEAGIQMDVDGDDDAEFQSAFNDV